MDNKPKLILVTGRPGSGKTTLAFGLGRLMNLPLLSLDEIKEGDVSTFGIPHSN